jgi:hypothetical protein
MNPAKLFLRDLFDDIVERKLWPVALILLVALIAIPIVLAKPASKPGAPVPPAGAGTAAVPGAASPLTAFEPVVSTAVTSGKSKGLRGRAKNPFLARGIDLSAAEEAGSVEPIPGLGDAAVSTGETAVGAGDSAPESGDGQSGSQGGSGTGQKYFTYTIKVRFGEEGDASARTLSQFRALPSSDNPVAIFMGVKRDGKTAVFLLSSSVTTTGDGDCEPTDSTCTFLYLKPGDTQVIETVTTEGEIVTYELDLVDIMVKETDGPSSAGASRKARGSARTSDRKASRRAARARARHVQRAFSRLPF